MPHPVSWFQIQGPDGAALAEFYRQVFKWRMSMAPDGSMMMVEADGPGGIAGGIGTSMSGGPAVSVYINAVDLESRLTMIEAAGGRMAMPPMELQGGMGSIAGFIDPAGNWIGLWEPGRLPPKARPARTAAKAKQPAKAKAKAKAKPKAKARAKAKPRRRR
jgi:uncharacterized protein